MKIYNENQFLKVSLDSKKNYIFYTSIEEWNVVQSYINYLKPCHDIFNTWFGDVNMFLLWDIEKIIKKTEKNEFVCISYMKYFILIKSV